MTTPQSTRPLRTWILGNLPALVVLALCVPALAFVLIGLPILENVTDEVRFQSVEPGGTITSNGYSLTLTSSNETIGMGAAAGGNDIPRGTSLIAVIIEITPDAPELADDSYCSAELTSRAFGAERRWSKVSNVEAFGYAAAENSSMSCSLEGEALTLEVVFLTPDATYDDATLDVSFGDDKLRFGLMP